MRTAVERRLRLVGLRRHPVACVKCLEARRHDADQSRRSIAENEGFSQDVRITTKLAAPEWIADEEYRRSIGFAVLRRNSSPKEWRDSKKIERVRRDGCPER